jgi:ferredoxin
MEGNGPSNGSPRKLGLIAASRSPHALDMACAHMIGLTPNDVPTLKAAQRRGLLPQSIDELPIAGDLADFAVSDFKTGAHRDIGVFANRFTTALVKGGFAARPVAEAGCTGCGECGRLCPVDAIVMQNGRPVIDRSKCIRCFCCQEFCPTGAMKAKRPFLARMLNR